MKQPLDAVPLWLFFTAVCELSGLALEGDSRRAAARPPASRSEPATASRARLTSPRVNWAALADFRASTLARGASSASAARSIASAAFRTRTVASGSSLS